MRRDDVAPRPPELPIEGERRREVEGAGGQPVIPPAPTNPPGCSVDDKEVAAVDEPGLRAHDLAHFECGSHAEVRFPDPNISMPDSNS